jgi:LacI family transcriptional regulator
MSCSLDVLDQLIATERDTGVALHAQIRRALRTVVERHFDDGQKFFTEAELGKRLGVSQGTLRRALLDLTREGLLERRVAKGSFVRKRSSADRVVAIFVPTFESPFWAGLLDEFSHACRDLDYAMQVFHAQSSVRTAIGHANAALPPSAMRFVLMGDATSSARLYGSLTAKGYRTVAVDVLIPGYRGPTVQVDNAAGMRLAVDHLVDLGHTDIALLVDEPMAEESVVERVAGFNTQTRTRGCEPRVIDCGTKHGDVAYDRAMEMMPRLWKKSPRPTALCTASDPGAWAVLKWCAAHGVKVPDKLSVVGFDNDRPSIYQFPALTSVAQPIEAIAREALTQLWSEKPTTHHILLPPRLEIRQSTGPRPNA